MRRALLFSVLAPAVAFAAGDAHHGEPASITTLAFPVINFLLFAALIRFLVWPKVADALVARREQIQALLSEGARERDAAASLHAEIQKKLDEVATEREHFLAGAKTEGESQRAVLLAGAEAAAQRIRNDARLVGEHEALRGAGRIRTELSRRITERATELIRARLADGEPADLVDGFLADIEKGRAA